MKPAKPISIALLGPIAVLAASRLLRPAPPPPRASVAPFQRARPNTPFERTLRQGWTLRSRALLGEMRAREALERWDPAVAGRDESPIRYAALARDRGGDLRRAREAACQAAAFARTPGETRRAALLRLLIERDLGHDPPR